MSDHKEYTHFGYEKVTKEEKQEKVDAVFDSVASKYDLMNDLMSLGTHRIWKRQAISRLKIRPAHTVLDLAGGSGDLTKLIYDKLDETGSVTLADINPNMLDIAKSKLLDKGYFSKIKYCLANAEQLPFADNSFDRAIIGFGLRNVTDKQQALTELYRVLKPTGRLVVLEFSKPNSELLNKAYSFYSFNILPKIGKYIAQDEASYRYLAESIDKHPNQKELCCMLEQASFSACKYENIFSGIVAIHIGLKI